MKVIKRVTYLELQNSVSVNNFFQLINLQGKRRFKATKQQMSLPCQTDLWEVRVIAGHSVVVSNSLLRVRLLLVFRTK